MNRLANFRVAGVAVAALGLVAAACQPQVAPPPADEAAAPAADTLTVAEVEALVVGNTVLARDEGRKVSRAEFFAPDGTVKLKAKPDFMGFAFSYDGTYYFGDEGKFCTEYPTLPVDPKLFCEHVVTLDDGRYGLTDGAVYERILEGERLDALE